MKRQKIRRVRCIISQGRSKCNSFPEIFFPFITRWLINMQYCWYIFINMRRSSDSGIRIFLNNLTGRLINSQNVLSKMLTRHNFYKYHPVYRPAPFWHSHIFTYVTYHERLWIYINIYPHFSEFRSISFICGHNYSVKPSANAKSLFDFTQRSFSLRVTGLEPARLPSGS